VGWASACHLPSFCSTSTVYQGCGKHDHTGGRGWGVWDGRQGLQKSDALVGGTQARVEAWGKGVGQRERRRCDP
jgi:hypothetical protein